MKAGHLRVRASSAALTEMASCHTALHAMWMQWGPGLLESKHDHVVRLAEAQDDAQALRHLARWPRVHVTLSRAQALRLVRAGDAAAMLRLPLGAAAARLQRACREALQLKVGRPLLTREALADRVTAAPNQGFRDERELRRLKRRSTGAAALDAWLEGVEARGETLLTSTIPPPS